MIVGRQLRVRTLAQVLHLEHQKDAAGARAMLALSKPRKARKDENPGQVYWHDEPARLAQLYAYCQQDVEITRALFRLLSPLLPAELAIWQLNERVNDRGFFIDRPLIEAARRLAETVRPKVNRELAEVTGGTVTSINQVARLNVWLQEHGL